MDLRELKYFIAVAELGSLSRAAALLSVAQPALSRQVRKLEAGLGVELFHRTGRGVTLTAEGEQLLARTRPLIEEVAQIESELRAERRIPRGLVTLGMPPSVSAALTVPLLLSFRAKFPEASLRIVDGFSTHIEEWLLAGRLDVGLFYLSGQTAVQNAIPLLAEDLYLFGGARTGELPNGWRRTVGLREIEGLPLILPAPHHGLRRLIDRAAVQAGIRLSVVIEIDAVSAIKDLVRRGIGYSILTYGGIHSEVAAGALRASRIAEPELFHHMVIASNLQAPSRRMTAEVIRLARAELYGLMKDGALTGRPPAPDLSAPAAVASTGRLPVRS